MLVPLEEKKRKKSTRAPKGPFQRTIDTFHAFENVPKSYDGGRECFKVLISIVAQFELFLRGKVTRAEGH